MLLSRIFLKSKSLVAVSKYLKRQPFPVDCNGVLGEISHNIFKIAFRQLLIPT